MLGLLVIHGLVCLYLMAELLCTAFHESVLSVCGHYGESTLLLFLLANLLLTLVYYINYKLGNAPELNILKRTRFLFFLLILSSPVYLATPFFPGIFCRYTEFSRSALGSALSCFSLVLIESFAAVVYFIRYDRYIIHKELFPSSVGNADTSLRL